MASAIDREKLIVLISGRKLLYDKTSPDYRNRIKTDAAWQEICDCFEGYGELLFSSLFSLHHQQ